jgi:phage terminase large subunit GpA-like protein
LIAALGKDVLANPLERHIAVNTSLLASTPVHKLTSIIWREYQESDMRRFHVPCRACGTPQVLQWSNVKWDKGPNGEHLPETAYYLCEHCGAIWDDVERNAAIAEADRRGRAGDCTCGWIAEHPGRSTAGFHIPAFLSPWLTLKEIVDEFLKARHDPSLLQVWTNTTLGEPWEEAAERLEGAPLIARLENYGSQSLPIAVRVITVGVDVQGDRLELVVIGWGEHDESWMIDHEVIFGDPAQSDVWAQLDALLRTPYCNEYGHELRIRSCCIDSGGHHQTQVVDFCKSRWRRRIYATKGQAGTRPIWPKRASRTRNHEVVYSIGVDSAKDTVYNRLRITKPGPGYIHFPVGDACDAEFFAQLTAEQVVTRKREGRPYRVWVLPSGRRNEILDCVVLALAAYKSAPAALEGQLAPTALATVVPPPPMSDMAGVRIMAVDPKPRVSRIREMARRMNPPR